MRPPAPLLEQEADPARQSSIVPGGALPAAELVNPYEGNAFAISEGQRLYSQFNCVGCHANGGGGMGPPLMDEKWIYGSDPANLFDTLSKGRPNGMPAWSGRVPEQQMWQLVSYVRALAGLEPKSAIPPRRDDLEEKTTAVEVPGKPP